MSASFTPGPWQRGHMGDAERAWIGPVVDHMPQTPVAHVDRNERDNWEANAQLMTAAPDLLAALRELLEASEISADDLPSWEHREIVEDAQNRARKAIAKAVAS